MHTTTTGDQRISATGKEGPKLENDVLVAPGNTIVGPAAARTVVQRLKHSHRKRCWNFERIQGMLDGNPPYNPIAMKQAGLSDMSNVNWKDGESVYGSVALAYWSLFNDVENIAEFHVDFGDDEALKTEYGTILAEEFNKTVRSWPDFDKRMTFHQGELIKFGLSAIIWPDENDWRFKAVNIQSFLVPDKTENSMDRLTTVVIEHDYPAQFLFGVYEAAKANKGGLWDADALGHILWQLAEISDEQRKDITDCDGLQDSIRNGDLYYSALYNDDITFVSLLTKEYDEKVTHHMIHRTIDTEEFPYFFNRQYKNFSEAMSFFTYRPGEEYIHGNKGLGHSIFSGMEAITQLDCSVIDQAKRAGSLIIKGGPNRRDERQVKFTHGGIIDVGEAEIEQNAMGSNVSSSVEVSRYFQDKVRTNNNVSGSDPSFADRNVQSVRQGRNLAHKEAKIHKNQISHYYTSLDYFFREMLRKMLLSGPSDGGWDYVSIWKQRCIARGVPEELFQIRKAKLTPNGLPDYLDVTASRSAGSGSQIADQDEMREVMSILPTLGERGRVQAIKDWIAAFRGFRFVGRYFPPEDQQQQPTGDDTLASIENNQLVEGKQIVVSPDNNHAVHAPAHIKMMSEWMQLYTQDPEAPFDKSTNILQKVDDVFSVSGPHLVKHLFFLERDPTRKALFQQLNAEWSVLANFGDMITHNARRQREADERRAQEVQQAEAEQAAENTPAHIKVRGDIEIKDKKADADIQRDARRDSFKFALETQKIERSGEIEAAKATQEIAIKAKKELEDGNN